jgi:hypothetical protein
MRDEVMIGVCTFGQASRALQLHAFTEPVAVLELNRFYLKPEYNHANVGSWFIARVLRLLPRPVAIVSFADTGQGHSGGLYRAANFLYTGLTVSRSRMYLIGTELVHERALYNNGITNPSKWAKDNGVHMTTGPVKHRYYYFLGSHKERRWFRDNLKTAIIDFPKETENAKESTDGTA